jgi:hypothetical protein
MGEGPGEWRSWVSWPAGLLDYKALRCRWPATLLIRSEKRDLSDHAAEIADFMVRIPMRGGCDLSRSAFRSSTKGFRILATRSDGAERGIGESGNSSIGTGRTDSRRSSSTEQ